MNAIPPRKSEPNPSTGPGRREPVVPGGSFDDLKAEAAQAMAAIRRCVQEFARAVQDEGIDPQAPLGIWSRALQNSLGALALFMDLVAERVDERAEVVERAMQAEVERVRVAIQQCQAETMLARMKTAETVELRKVENVELARELGTEISKTIRTAALVREVRFNRRQNWSAVALLATVLLGCFVGGAVWSSNRADESVVTRCLKSQQVDETGKTYWCAMTVVRNGT